MSNAGISAEANLRREAALAAERAVELERRLALASPEARERAWTWHEVHISDRKDGVLWIWVPICDGGHTDKYLWADGKTSAEVVNFSECFPEYDIELERRLGLASPEVRSRAWV